MTSIQIFLLSPARLDGQRGKLLLAPKSDFPLAVKLGESKGATLGEVFSFLSGLYFRGKLAYASAFARAPEGVAPIQIITTHRGLLTPETRVTRKDLEAFAEVDLGEEDERFKHPFLRDARALDASLGPDARVILLGSIATGKYIDPLLSVFRSRLLFPTAFVGRGDMSRGGLLLRGERSGTELEYASVASSIRKGKRPPKLAPVK